MKRFEKAIKPIVKNLADANPKIVRNPSRKTLHTSISKQFSEKPKDTLNKPDGTPKADGESNGRNLTEKIPKNNISQSELIKNPSLTKLVNEVNLRQQAAEAFANLQQQNGEKGEASEFTKGVVVEGVTKLQEHFPHFRNAFQRSLEKSNTSVTELDSFTNNTSRDISDPKKQDSVNQLSDYPKTKSETKEQILVIKDAEMTIAEINSDISNLEKVIKHEKKIKDIQRTLDSYGLDSSFELYDHSRPFHNCESPSQR